MLAATWPTSSLSMPVTIDAGRGGHLEGDAVGRLDLDRVAEAERELERARALGGGAVADADDLELLGKPSVTPTTMLLTSERIEAVQGPVLALVVGTLDEERRRRPGGW